MIEWKRVPWTLWVYSALTIMNSILVELTVPGPVLALVILAIVVLVWLFLLLKGLRWIWITTLVATLISYGIDAFAGTLQGRDVGLLLISLLLLPATRRYFENDVAVDAAEA